MYGPWTIHKSVTNLFSHFQGNRSQFDRNGPVTPADCVVSFFGPLVGDGLNGSLDWRETVKPVSVSVYCLHNGKRSGVVHRHTTRLPTFTPDSWSDIRFPTGPRSVESGVPLRKDQSDGSRLSKTFKCVSVTSPIGSGIVIEFPQCLFSRLPLVLF